RASDMDDTGQFASMAMASTDLPSTVRTSLITAKNSAFASIRRGCELARIECKSSRSDFAGVRTAPDRTVVAMASETPPRPTGRLLDFRSSREEIRDAVRAARIATAKAKV